MVPYKKLSENKITVMQTWKLCIHSLLNVKNGFIVSCSIFIFIYEELKVLACDMVFHFSTITICLQ